MAHCTALLLLCFEAELHVDVYRQEHASMYTYIYVYMYIYAYVYTYIYIFIYLFIYDVLYGCLHDFYMYQKTLFLIGFSA